MSDDARREAGVLVPVYRDAIGRLRMIFVRRSAGGRHGGQLAFPGGSREDTDTDLTATALREAEEEIGLAASAVEVVAELPPVDTATTGFRITPVLGRLRGPVGRWRVQETEIAAVIDVAVAELAAPGARVERLLFLPGWPRPRMVQTIVIGDDLLWGATLRIVDPLLPRLLAGEWRL